MKVVVAGTFDILHPGHLHLLEKAAQFGDVYVIKARNCNINKNKTVFKEEERWRMTESLKMVKKEVLGNENDFLNL